MKLICVGLVKLVMHSICCHEACQSTETALSVGPVVLCSLKDFEWRVMEAVHSVSHTQLLWQMCIGPHLPAMPWWEHFRGKPCQLQQSSSALVISPRCVKFRNIPPKKWQPLGLSVTVEWFSQEPPNAHSAFTEQILIYQLYCEALGKQTPAGTVCPQALWVSGKRHVSSGNASLKDVLRADERYCGGWRAPDTALGMMWGIREGFLEEMIPELIQKDH